MQCFWVRRTRLFFRKAHGVMLIFKENAEIRDEGAITGEYPVSTVCVSGPSGLGGLSAITGSTPTSYQRDETATA